MSTRGIYGFRKNGADKLTYNHCDSYPSGLGAEVARFCKETSIEEMNGIFDRIELIDTDIKPTPEQIKNCERWTNLSVGKKSTSDWYCLLYKAQGNMSDYKEGLRYMPDDSYFIRDSLFCEYGYIINLDNNTLEYWKGFQHKAQKGNRYGTNAYKTADGNFYPCKLSLSFPLDNIPENAVEQMEDKK